MFHENEIVMLLLGVGVLILVLANRIRLKRVPASKILIAGFYIFLAGWAMTVLEGFFWHAAVSTWPATFCSQSLKY